MPDVVIFTRPDVTIAAAVPATVPHARLVSYTNAVQVAAEATDLGRVNVTVGLGINVNVTLGVQTTIDPSAGHVTAIVAGNAVTTGAGGNVTVTAGVAAGAGFPGGGITLTAGVAAGNSASGGITLTGANTSGGVSAGGSVTINTGTGGTSSGAGSFVVNTGAGVGGLSSEGGNILFTLGAGGGATGSGGRFVVTCGASVGANAGGVVAITTGQGGPLGGGAGGALTLTTGAAGVGSAANGGDLLLVPGAGDGAGVRGLIRITATTATAIQPDTTDVVTLGATTLAFVSVRTLAIQSRTGQALTIFRQDGTAWATLSTGTSATVISLQTNFSATGLWLDNTNLAVGTGSDAALRWSTNSANNALHFWIGVNSAAQSGNVLLTTAANASNEHGLAAVLTPRLAVFSAAAMNVAANRVQYVQHYHDGTDAQFVAGTGRFVFTGQASAAGTAGFVTVTQPLATSGTPTGLLYTGAAHTTLTLSVESIDWNVNLARTVQFATGALALQRAVVIQAPTYGFVGASTVTTVATLVVTAAPTAGANATFTNPICVQFGGSVTIGATTAGLSYRVLDVPAHTVTLTGVTQVTATVGAAACRLDVITLSDAAAVTVDHAATLHIIGPPVGGGTGPVTITTPWAIRCDTGSIGAGAGTTARPALGFSGDPNTGLYSQAAGAIGVVTNGVERARFDTEAGAGNLALLVSVAGAGVLRVSVGANDSGGAGTRLLRVPN